MILIMFRLSRNCSSELNIKNMKILKLLFIWVVMSWWYLPLVLVAMLLCWIFDDPEFDFLKEEIKLMFFALPKT